MKPIALLAISFFMPNAFAEAPITIADVSALRAECQSDLADEFKAKIMHSEFEAYMKEFSENLRKGRRNWNENDFEIAIDLITQKATVTSQPFTANVIEVEGHDVLNPNWIPGYRYQNGEAHRYDRYIHVVDQVRKEVVSQGEVTQFEPFSIPVLEFDSRPMEIRHTATYDSLGRLISPDAIETVFVPTHVRVIKPQDGFDLQVRPMNAATQQPADFSISLKKYVKCIKKIAAQF